ncbi:MAG: SDR family oxidoreductase [Candidatus Sulfotelmatobacter sp.]
MKIAITGGTGFVGSHLAKRALVEGHDVVLLSRTPNQKANAPDYPGRVTRVSSELTDIDVLAAAFAGCQALAHCAGINREIGRQTYRQVHVEGTRNVVDAAKRAGVRRLALMSFLRARPDCGSPYHESKWAAEEIVRNSGLDFTVVKAGMVYGRGDHMLDHLSHALYTLPIFATVGFQQKAIRPLAIDDLIHVLYAALVNGRLTRQTIAITGAEELYLSDAARRVAEVLGRRIWIFPAPLWFHYALAMVCEVTMKVPLEARAQVRILSEGVVEPATACDPLPADLLPVQRFTEKQIRGGLPEPGPFGVHDLRCCA